MNKICSALLMGSLALPLGAFAAPAYVVTNGGDSGAGSLRHGLESGATSIVIPGKVTMITLDSTLVYSGQAPLSINGSGQVIDGATPELLGDGIFHVTGGADLTLSNLEFLGAGGYSIENPGGSKGIFVEIPGDREGTVSVQLTNITVRDTGYHGVHISDCQAGDDCGAGAGNGEEEGSAASVRLRMTGVVIDHAGFGRQDGDGVRVDDREAGDIGLLVTNSIFQYVGGDGMELDEGGEGDVLINVRDSLFDGNGAYCFDYDDDGPFDPIAIDPACDDDGDPDVDDAFDIDEAGPGKIAGKVSNVDVFQNYDEGLDFDTAGGGDDNGISVDLDLVSITGIGNTDESVKVSEEDDGTVLVNMRSLDIDEDVEIEEEDDGDLHVTLNGSSIGDDLKLKQDGDGMGTLKVRGSYIDDDIDLEGDITEI